jgi:catechol 2,3-dioxygenase-like lactoylglutathione lyase family enzyme
MHTYDIAIPILPCKSIDATAAFYKTLGFEAKIWGAPYHYAILTRDTVEIHFFTQPDLDPARSSAGCYVRVLNVNETFRAFSNAQLSATGIPRIDKIEDKPWGMREFAIVDLNGNLIRIGQPL